jgi:hypothetical protein
MEEKGFKRGLLLVSLIAAVLFFAFAYYVLKDQEKIEPKVFLIPKGYVGQVVIEYRQKDASPVPHEGKYEVYKFSADGKAKTPEVDPPAIFPGGEDKFYFVDENGNRTEIDRATLIHGAEVGVPQGEHIPLASFFVGTFDQYQEWVKEQKEKTKGMKKIRFGA